MQFHCHRTITHACNRTITHACKHVTNNLRNNLSNEDFFNVLMHPSCAYPPAICTKNQDPKEPSQYLESISQIVF